MAKSSDAGKKLFHAVVVAGAAIGGCAADGGEPPSVPEAGAAANQAMAGSAGTRNAGEAGGGGLGGGGLGDVDNPSGTGGAVAGTTGGAGTPRDAGQSDEDAEVTFPHITM